MDDLIEWKKFEIGSFNEKFDFFQNESKSGFLTVVGLAECFDIRLNRGSEKNRDTPRTCVSSTRFEESFSVEVEAKIRSIAAASASERDDDLSRGK